LTPAPNLGKQNFGYWLTQNISKTKASQSIIRICVASSLLKCDAVSVNNFGIFRRKLRCPFSVCKWSYPIFDYVDFEVVYYKVRRTGGDYQWSRHYIPQDMEFRKRVIKARTIVRSENFSKHTDTLMAKCSVYYNVKVDGVGDTCRVFLSSCRAL
jgi:hypothetical protein